MPSGWKYKVWLTFFFVLASAYVLSPSLLDLPNKRATWAEKKQAEPFYSKILPERGLNLGLDLRGGLYLELQVDVEEAMRHQIDFLANDIKRALFKDDLAKTEIFQIPGKILRINIPKAKQDKFLSDITKIWGPNVFEVQADAHEVFLTAKADVQAARKVVIDTARAALGKGPVVTVTADGKLLGVAFSKAAEQEALQKAFADPAVTESVALTADPEIVQLQVANDYLTKINKDIFQQAANSVRNRIDRFGVAEASVTRSGDRLVIELPGEKDPKRIIEVVQKTGKLEFRLVDQRKTPQEISQLVDGKLTEMGVAKALPYSKETIAKLNDQLQAELPPETEIVFEWKRDLNDKVIGGFPYLLDKKADVTGDMLQSAGVSSSRNNQPAVSLSFNETGTEKFATLTAENVGHQLAIVLDDTVMSAPNLDEPIPSGQAQISFGFGTYDRLVAEAKDLVLILKEGALPASLTVASQNVIGPSLGADAIHAGLLSIFIAAAAVIVFMLIYYRLGGVVANVALILNVLFIFALMAIFQGSLTLPGLGGIVLTMGMAVDANVIIFERMREEHKLGKAMNAIVPVSYENAFRAILDGHTTTFISGLVLFQFGTGPIKGFATTLMIGIITTLFTAVLVTRLFYDWLVAHGKLKSLSFF